MNNDRDYGKPGMVEEIKMRPMRGMRAMRCVGVVKILLMYCPKKNGHQHQSGSVRRGHQERP